MEECARSEDKRFATLVIAAAVLLGFVGLKACAEWLWPPVIGALAFALFHLGWRTQDARIGRAGEVFGFTTLAFLLASASISRLVGEQAQGDLFELATWAVLATLAAFLAWRSEGRTGRFVQPAAVLIAYGAAAQILPAFYLPAAPVAILATLASTLRQTCCRPASPP